MSRWEEWKAKNRPARPWDFLNPNTVYVSEEEHERRYSICKECPHLIALTKQCTQCGCFMHAKTKLEHATCPIGKW